MKDQSIDKLWRYRLCCRYWRNQENAHTFIIAIYIYIILQTISPELPAVFICNNIQTNYAFFAIRNSETRSRSRGGASARATWKPCLMMIEERTNSNICLDFSRAVAGVCGAPVQVVPVGPVWNSLIWMYVWFIYLFVLYTMLKFFLVCRCPSRNRTIKCKIVLNSLHCKNDIYSQTKMYSDTFSISHIITVHLR